MAVVASIALLVQLALPAINLAREESRKQHCKHNLQQLGTALQAYHDLHQELPPAALWQQDHGSKPRDVEVGYTNANWVTHLLPQLDRQGLYDTYHWDQPISDRANSDFRNMQLPRMMCPSDAYNTDKNRYFRGYEPGKHAIGKFYARGNYALNGGSQARCRFPGHTGMPCASGYLKENLSEKTSMVWGVGIGGFNKSFSFDDFTSPLSKTVAVDEIRAGLHPLDPRGVWSVGQVGMSITWAHGVHGDAVGPNNPTVDSDDIHGCHEVGLYLGIERLVEERMGCCDHCLGGNEQAGARSMHPGGVHVLMCDGSVHFVDDDIDQSMWHVLHSRENPQDFDWP